jgi:ribosomal protein L11 methyltransferase
MEWLEITVNTHHQDIDDVCARLDDLGVDGVVIDDEEDFKDFLENSREYWDYVDEDLLAQKKNVSRVKFYLENSQGGMAQLRNIEAAMPEREFSVRTVRDEDWENNWRQYYKPVEVGERLLIVPEWEKVENSGGRAVLRLDPGLIFGTGAHATTQMCLRALENYAAPGKKAIDLGCGSGILGIAAILLGADSSVGCDIDDKAPHIAMENAALNGVGADKFSVYAGDVLTDSHMKAKMAGKYDIVLANIVADVIIAMAPQAYEWTAEDGVFICSGIIEGREDEVKAALSGCGFKIREEHKQDNWNCYVCGRM